MSSLPSQNLDAEAIQTNGIALTNFGGRATTQVPVAGTMGNAMFVTALARIFEQEPVQSILGMISMMMPRDTLTEGLGEMGKVPEYVSMVDYLSIGGIVIDQELGESQILVVRTVAVLSIFKEYNANHASGWLEWMQHRLTGMASLLSAPAISFLGTQSGEAVTVFFGQANALRRTVLHSLALTSTQTGRVKYVGSYAVGIIGEFGLTSFIQVERLIFGGGSVILTMPVLSSEVEAFARAREYYRQAGPSAAWCRVTDPQNTTIFAPRNFPILAAVAHHVSCQLNTRMSRVLGHGSVNLSSGIGHTILQAHLTYMQTPLGASKYQKIFGKHIVQPQDTPPQ